MVKEWIVRHSIPKYSIHTSGHASPGELQKLVSAINPRNVVPIHSFYPDKYPELFPNVETHNDGEWWEV
jgi:ribonuclease J